ncbi:DNA-directed RNA polymerase subunit beta [Salsuginibacillus kocurii]|uniref:DNA-directed RNA polymerase subunit beta n=1 Tax=Salsuginibacillus kocurii TaxID=427078 RepID=UPI00036E900B|nr:DNA-directed RNA polymerase subunit beta [Salsuginibacillus kocurii]
MSNKTEKNQSEESRSAKGERRSKPAEEKEEQVSYAEKRKREGKRMFPIWLRLVIVVVLALLSIVFGLIAGYSWFGDGDNATGILRPGTWLDLLDFIRPDR